jgi:hypothetical protein
MPAARAQFTQFFFRADFALAFVAFFLSAFFFVDFFFSPKALFQLSEYCFEAPLRKIVIIRSFGSQSIGVKYLIWKSEMSRCATDRLTCLTIEMFESTARGR